MSDDLVQRLREMGEHPCRVDFPIGADLREAADRIEQLEREKAVVSDLWEQQKEIALDYLTDCNKAADRIEAQAAEIERLQVEAKAQFDRGYYDGCSNPIVRHDALREAVIEECAKALEADARLCDCFARMEVECGCGAWDDNKTITSERAIGIIRALQEQSK